MEEHRGFEIIRIILVMLIIHIISMNSMFSLSHRFHFFIIDVICVNRMNRYNTYGKLIHVQEKIMIFVGGCIFALFDSLQNIKLKKIDLCKKCLCNSSQYLSYQTLKANLSDYLIMTILLKYVKLYKNKCYMFNDNE